MLARSRGRSLATGTLIVMCLAIGACGSAEDPTILNTEKIERAIERSSLVQRGKRVHVSCPSGVHQKKGLVFSCTTVGARARTRFVVTELDDAGNVRYVAP